jgi:hypothetical protein
MLLDVGEGPLPLFAGGIGEDTDELVPAPADHQVIGAQPFADGSHHIGEQGVSGSVTLAVIDAFEAVDVDEDRGHALAPESVEARDLPGQRLEAGTPAERSGEVVDRGRRGEALDLANQGAESLQPGGDVGVDRSSRASSGLTGSSAVRRWPVAHPTRSTGRSLDSSGARSGSTGSGMVDTLGELNSGMDVPRIRRLTRLLGIRPRNPSHPVADRLE